MKREASDNSGTVVSTGIVVITTIMHSLPILNTVYLLLVCIRTGSLGPKSHVTSNFSSNSQAISDVLSIIPGTREHTLRLFHTFPTCGKKKALEMYA